MVAQLLLEMGADLHEAASDGREAEIRLLLENRANIGAEGINGQTALHRAASSGHEAVIQAASRFWGWYQSNWWGW